MSNSLHYFIRSRLALLIKHSLCMPYFAKTSISLHYFIRSRLALVIKHSLCMPYFAKTSISLHYFIRSRLALVIKHSLCMPYFAVFRIDSIFQLAKLLLWFSFVKRNIFKACCRAIYFENFKFNGFPELHVSLVSLKYCRKINVFF